MNAGLGGLREFKRVTCETCNRAFAKADSQRLIELVRSGRSDFLARVQTAWEAGDERAGVAPLIVRVKGERDGYTLHDSRKAALEFIVEGGRRTTQKRAEGKASARKRARGSGKGRPPKRAG